MNRCDSAFLLSEGDSPGHCLFIGPQYGGSEPPAPVNMWVLLALLHYHHIISGTIN